MNGSTPPPLWCSRCERYETPNSEWRALWFDAEGNLVVGRPWEPRMRDAQSAIFVCGQEAALIMAGRYLSTGKLERTSHPASLPVARV